MTRIVARSAGFTLAEMLVAMSVFTMIGGMLLMALRSGVDTWSRTEEQRMIHEDAQALLKLIREDLTSMVSTGGSGGDPGILLVCDYDRNRRQRIRFIRTIKAEDSRTPLRLSGTGSPEEGYTEYMTDKGDSSKKLLPLGGLMEVAYAFDPGDPLSPALYRGVRAPIGGPDSLFIDGNIDSSEKVKKAMSAISGNVLFLGFAFWSQYTTTWDSQAGQGRTLTGGCGPSDTWDSTRGILPKESSQAKKGDANVFFMAANQASRQVTADDIFPRQVQVTLAVLSRTGRSLSTVLADDLSPGEKTIRVEDARGFPDETDPMVMRHVKVGAEWMRIKGRTGEEIEIDRRGARGTSAQGHKKGGTVLCGRTFVVTASVPSYREFWFGENPGAASK